MKERMDGIENVKDRKMVWRERVEKVRMGGGGVEDQECDII
jgi:hypothetical protein